jgi:hypothetical protein
MSAGVDETNVCDVLQFAETFRANKLRRYCIDYMAAPTFPSHLIDAAQLKPELLEQVLLLPSEPVIRHVHDQ